jgi:hypothetical protein
VGGAPNFFWKQKVLQNITMMANSQKGVVCHSVLPQDMASLPKDA